MRFLSPSRFFDDAASPDGVSAREHASSYSSSRRALAVVALGSALAATAYFVDRQYHDLNARMYSAVRGGLDDGLTLTQMRGMVEQDGERSLLRRLQWDLASDGFYRAGKDGPHRDRVHRAGSRPGPLNRR